MGGQLYYRTLAHYSAHCRPGTTPIQPPFLVYHLLAQCATVEEVVQVLRKELTLVDRPFWGTVPPLHWTFSDRTGESIVVEPDEDGLHIHRSTIGVMTNSRIIAGTGSTCSIMPESGIWTTTDCAYAAIT